MIISLQPIIDLQSASYEFCGIQARHLHPGKGRSTVIHLSATTCQMNACWIRIECSAGMTSNHRIMKEPTAESKLAMLLALKRGEKPPENFLQDFLAEFHRRNHETNLQRRAPTPRIERRPH
jgi:hypothetical protein